MQLEREHANLEQDPQQKKDSSRWSAADARLTKGSEIRGRECERSHRLSKGRTNGLRGGGGGGVGGGGGGGGGVDGGGGENGALS